MPSRRDFAKAAMGGGAGLLARAAWPAPLLSSGEGSWTAIREQFPIAPGLAFMNAANLCPSAAPVVESLIRNTRALDRDPSPATKAGMAEGREAVRRQLAAFLRVRPEEIVITRNTSEANNLVSSGLDLGAGDEVLIFSDNHASNHGAWTEKAKRFGFAVKIVDQANPHPGPEYYLEAFRRSFTPRTRVLAFTHVTNSAGDLLPAKELCALARERGALSLVDGAQTFGVMDLDLGDMQPDFFTASAHKWSCGPREAGLVYVSSRAQSRVAPSIISLYPGAVGTSRTLEAFGQRNEPAILAFGEALAFQERIGRRLIEGRARELARALMEGLRKIEGARLWTHPDPARSLAVVSFLPAGLDARRLAAVLYEEDRIGCATRGGSDRPGLRLSPHLYNSHAEVDRVLATLKRRLAAGI